MTYTEHTEPSVSTLEAEGTRVVQQLGQLGFAASYELAQGETPVISLGLTEAALLLQRIEGLYRTLEKAVGVGQELAQYAAYLETEGSAGQDPGQG